MSNKFAQFVLAASFLASASIPAAFAQAAPPAAGPARIGIISMQDAVLASNEGQKEFAALGAKFEPKRTEIKSLADELESLKKQLDTQGTKLNDDARADLVKKIEAKQKTLTRSSEDAQNDFQAQQNETFQKILQKMGPVLDKYAKENGLGVILDASRPWPEGQVLWANDSVNITKPVVDAYNTASGVAAPATPAAKPAAAKPAAPKPVAPKTN
jgi:outer membrane protein